jgi:LysR family transcriptional regulator, nod-box dependent transcriptional activator
MRFKGLDLNLLVALDVLLARQSVSRAAEQLHLSQPAVSAALARLRDYFRDPLLVPDGKRMIPTPHALRLKPLLATVLADVGGLVAVSPAFDPANSTRRFRVGASDYLTIVLFAPLLRRLAAEAPGISIELLPPNDVIQRQLEGGDLDLLILPSPHISPEHPSEDMFTEKFVVAGWRRHRAFLSGMTVEAFKDCGHIVVEIGNLFRASVAEFDMKRMGIERRVEVTVSSFSVVPDLLVETQRLAVMHERLARHAAKTLPIDFVPLPFDLPPMREVVQYHRTRSDDPGLRWLIDALREHV